MPNGFRFLLVLAVLATAAWAFTFQVPENEVAIVTRFGDPRRVVDEAGLHFKWPPPIDTVVRIDMRTHILDPGSAEYLTRDKKNIIVDPFMAWSVRDPVKFLRVVQDQRTAAGRLTDVLRSVTGDVLAAHDFRDLVSTDDQAARLDELLAALTRTAEQKAEENFGVDVQLVRLKRVNFPAQNKQSVFNRMEAERTTIADQYRAEGNEQFQKMKAQADREYAELITEAERKAAELRGQAEAEAARIYAEAYGADPEFFAFLEELKLFESALDQQSTLVLPADHPLLRVLRAPPSAPLAPTEGAPADGRRAAGGDGG